MKIVSINKQILMSLKGEDYAAQPERLSKIRRIAPENDVITVLELSNKLNVSPSTIRRDLKMLQDEGIVGRFHSGVTTHI